MIIEGYKSPELWFRSLSERRKPFLDAVDEIVLQHLKGPMLDVGSGDGVRVADIARRGNIADLVLTEPEKDMYELCRLVYTSKVIQVAAEELDQVNFDYPFNTITCLWNVFGDIDQESMQKALDNIKNLLSDSGKLIMDVGNRYNIRAYGWKNFITNLSKDIFSPTPSNGNFPTSSYVNGLDIRSTTHFFSPSEINLLIRNSGLRTFARYVIDSKTGEARMTTFEGHLVYVLGR